VPGFGGRPNVFDQQYEADIFLPQPEHHHKLDDAATISKF